MGKLEVANNKIQITTDVAPNVQTITLDQMITLSVFLQKQIDYFIARKASNDLLISQAVSMGALTDQAFKDQKDKLDSPAQQVGSVSP